MPAPSSKQDKAPAADSETKVVTLTEVRDNTDAPADQPDVEYEEVVSEIEGRSKVITRMGPKGAAA